MYTTLWHAKFCQNLPGFLEHMTKFWCFFSLQCSSGCGKSGWPKQVSTVQALLPNLFIEVFNVYVPCWPKQVSTVQALLPNLFIEVFNVYVPRLFTHFPTL